MRLRSQRRPIECGTRQEGVRVGVADVPVILYKMQHMLQLTKDKLDKMKKKRENRSGSRQTTLKMHFGLLDGKMDYLAEEEREDGDWIYRKFDILRHTCRTV